MGWEWRGGRRYYFGKVRIGDRVASVYLGGGAAGAMAEEYVAEARERREAERAQLLRARAEVAQAEALLAELDAGVDVAVDGTLIGLGYHRHDRGAWRRRRGA